MLNNTIFFIAGEASGDLLGANLARQLLHLRPDLKLLAIGGDLMRAQGVEIVFPNSSMNIIGWVGVLKNWRIIYKAMRRVREIFKKNRPDLLILIDYPGFNLRVAKMAKHFDIKVLYYVSPQIWAWKYQRVQQIRRYVHHMAVLFAFEEDIYRKENIPVTYVGHPLAYMVKAKEEPSQIFQRYQLNPQLPVVAIFPGSRQSEVRRLFPVIVAAIEIISAKIPGIQFVLPLASTLSRNDLQAYLNDKITVVEKDTYNILSICQAAIVKSGTSTLEVGLSQIPLVIIYKSNWINYWLARFVVHTTQIGLCNIVAQKSIAKELIQGAVTAENIADEVLRLLMNSHYRERVLADLKILSQQMQQPNSSKMTNLVLTLLQN